MVEAYAVSDLGQMMLSRPLCFCVDPAVIRSFDPRSIRRVGGKKGVCQYASVCPRCDPSLRSLCAYNVEKGGV
jgi:hypothetical protein